MNWFMAPRRLVILLGGTLFGFACGAEQPKQTPAGAARNTAAPAGPTGRIRGFVRLQGSLPAHAVEPITQDQTTCGTSVPLPRLALGKSNGVQRAFVFLDGVPSVQDFRPRGPVLVDQKQCQYVPHALI